MCALWRPSCALQSTGAAVRVLALDVDDSSDPLLAGNPVGDVDIMLGDVCGVSRHVPDHPLPVD